METMVKEKTTVRTQTKKVDFSTLGGVRYTTATSDDYRDLLSRPEPEPEPLYIKAIDVVSGPFAAEDDDEEKVYNLLRSGLLSNRRVVLSLSGIKMVSGFCCGTVGHLYRELPRELVDMNLKVVDMPHGMDFILEEVREMGILYRYDRPQWIEMGERWERLIEEYT
jgi:hypothetical protein